MDTMMRRARKRSPTIVPEVRLGAIWTGAILVPAGLLAYGLTVHFAVPVAAPCVAMAVGSFGLQVVAVSGHLTMTGVCFDKVDG